MMTKDLTKTFLARLVILDWFQVDLHSYLSFCVRFASDPVEFDPSSMRV